MLSIRLVTESTFGNNINNSTFMKKARKIQQVMKSNDDLKIVEKEGTAMLETARNLVPVRSGNLRDNGITLEQTSTGFRFYVNTQAAPYGPLVETGTHKMRAQPYFWPAVDRHRERIVAALLKYYRSL